MLVFRRDYNPGDKQFKSTKLGPLCVAKYSVGQYREPPEAGPVPNSEVRGQIGGKFKIGFDVFKRLVGIELKPELVRSVEISIRNARVLVYSNEALGDIRDLLTQKCVKYVNDNIATQNAYQIDQVLEASIDYFVTLTAKGSATAGVNLIARKLDGTIELVDENSARVSGSALYYGVSLRPLTTPLGPRSGPAMVARAGP